MAGPGRLGKPEEFGEVFWFAFSRSRLPDSHTGSVSWHFQLLGFAPCDFLWPVSLSVSAAWGPGVGESSVASGRELRPESRMNCKPAAMEDDVGKAVDL